MLGQLGGGLQHRSFRAPSPATLALEQERSTPPVVGGLSSGTTRQSAFGHLLEFPTPQAVQQAFLVAGNEFGLRPKRSQQDVSAQPERPRGRLTGPVQVVARLADIWGLDVDQLAMALDYESARDVDDLLSGVLTLRGRDRHERVRNLFRIREVLNGLFRDHGIERTWLRETHEQLGGQSVINLLLSGSMEQMILARRFVEHIAGR